ncbi:hypothetical protein NW764_015952 [Fusarium oxysporum]|nr:hypothetical protein NW764_015952 [Fusarium oxysporum]
MIPTQGNILRTMLPRWNLRSGVRTLPPKPRSALGTGSVMIGTKVGSTWSNSDGEASATLLNHGAYLDLSSILVYRIFLTLSEAIQTRLRQAAAAMTDWKSNDFMSQWDQKYVSTNVKRGSRPYDKEFFLALDSKLRTERPELQRVSHAIIAAACCAVGRADVVGQFFDHVTGQSTPSESQQVFLRLREAITIIFPYLGLPTCIPACYGMIGVVERKGSEFASTKVLRKDTIDDNDVQKGHQLRSRIYHGVGNSEIFSLMDRYFSDLITCSTVVTWGYLIAKVNEVVFQPQESHLIIATAIMALGATRQTKSHIKATLGIGNSVDCVKTVLATVAQIASWAGRPIGEFDVDDLAKQIQTALRR